jgi:hypothetical protein
MPFDYLLLVTKNLRPLGDDHEPRGGKNAEEGTVRLPAAKVNLSNLTHSLTPSALSITQT